MEANQKVQISVTRWVQEEVNVLDLLVKRIAEIRFYEDGQYDIYSDEFGRNEIRGGLLLRVGTLKGLGKADIDLFEADPRMFWELHIDQVNEVMVSSLSNIDNPSWRIE